MPQVPAKLGSLRNSNSTSSQDLSFDDGLGGNYFICIFLLSIEYHLIFFSSSIYTIIATAGSSSTSSASPMISKVVQPTATVSSVPVSGPSKSKP